MLKHTPPLCCSKLATKNALDGAANEGEKARHSLWRRNDQSGKEETHICSLLQRWGTQGRCGWINHLYATDAVYLWVTTDLCHQLLEYILYLKPVNASLAIYSQATKWRMQAKKFILQRERVRRTVARIKMAAKAVGSRNGIIKYQVAVCQCTTDLVPTISTRWHKGPTCSKDMNYIYEISLESSFCTKMTTRNNAF